MRWQITVAAPDGHRHDVLVDADPDTPAEAVAAGLGAVAPGQLWLAGRPFGGEVRLADTGLRDGSVLTSGDQAPAASRGRSGAGGDGSGALVDTGWELAVVSGPHAGRRCVAAPGAEIVVGRDATADLVLDDDSVSRRHARVVLGPGPAADGAGAPPPAVARAPSPASAPAARASVQDLGSTNGTWVRGRVIDGAAQVGEGDPIEIGSSLLEARRALPGDADVHVDEDGELLVNRPARIQPAVAARRVDVPAEPGEAYTTSLPWLQAAVPIVIGVVLYLVLRSTTMLIFAAFSPVVFFSSILGTHRRQRKAHASEVAAYRARLQEARRAVDEAAAEEERSERARWPDPVQVAAVASGPGRRLWERREHDDDFLVLRVGVARRPARVLLAGPGAGQNEALAVPDMAAAPVTVDLRKAGVLGVAGPTGAGRAAARWMLAQLAVWHAPASLRLYVLTSHDAGADWEWVRWLPHLRGDAPGDAVVNVGNDAATCEERLRELLRILDSRTDRDDRLGAADRVWSPSIVAVLDGARALRRLPGLPRLLKEGPGRGIYVIAVDSDSTRLPAEGRAELAFDHTPGGTAPVSAVLRVSGEDPVTAVLVDQVEPAWAADVARALSPLRDAGGEEAAVTLPATARLVDLLAIEADRPDDLASRWHAGRQTTRVPVGVSIDGTFFLDIRRDGPHALVAGTTGSGKSEFLQTLVASLAVANRPDAIHFLLVDYKGASAFADCAALPHTVGMVTNLDGQETQRALASLDAELRRRETRLRELGAADVDAAWASDPEGAAAADLSRLVLVIDEFAELVQELPEFVTGLIRIARLGRSLGVHLILATQRPAGVVTGEMRANTGLRVALRMEDPGDSMEVLEAPDAARIPRAYPGRAFARLGGGAGVIGFQAARVAGRRRGAVTGLPAPRITSVPWGRLGYPLPVRVAADTDVGTATDLHALVDCMREAAQRCGAPPGRSPWLPPLPSLLGTHQLDGATSGPVGGSGTRPPTDPGDDAGAVGQREPAPPGVAAAVFGLEDRPAEQSQVPARFDPVHGGHLAVIGSARSGRSTVLRTLAARLAAANPPDDVHLYALDNGNGALLALADLPHCGAVVRRTEGDRVERLVGRLLTELDRRQELLARYSFGDISEQRAAAEPSQRLPYMVLLVDRWEGLAAGYATDSADVTTVGIDRLVREGHSAGVRVVLSGDRVLLTDRLVAQIEDRLVLRLADREDYRLAGLNPRRIAVDPPPGRAVRAESGVEVQVAVLDRPGSPTDPQGPAQAEAVRLLARLDRWTPAWRRPLRVESLPTCVGVAELTGLAAEAPAHPVPEASAGAWWLPLGVGGDEAGPYAVDLAVLGGLVVAGPPRSGRSTALAAMAEWMASRRLPVVAVTPRPSPLTAVADRLGVPVLRDGSSASAHELVRRLEGGPHPLALVVDDADGFARTEADEALRVHLRQAGPGRVMVLAAGPVDEMRSELRGVIGEARRAKAGVLLSPGSPFDGDLFGVRLPRVFLERMPPGRGCLVLDGECHLVQLALPDLSSRRG